jgi:hypothetical protein
MTPAAAAAPAVSLEPEPERSRSLGDCVTPKSVMFSETESLSAVAPQLKQLEPTTQSPTDEPPKSAAKLASDGAGSAHGVQTLRMPKQFETMPNLNSVSNLRHSPRVPVRSVSAPEQSFPRLRQLIDFDDEHRFDLTQVDVDMQRVVGHLTELENEEYALRVLFTMRSAVELHRAWHMTLLTCACDTLYRMLLHIHTHICIMT